MKRLNILLLMLFGLFYLTSCDKVNAKQSGVLGGPNASVSSLDNYKVGDPVEDFALPGIDGSTVSMGNFPNAKGYIVVFTCNTCPYSKLYEGRIKALNSKYAANGWPLIAINPNDPEVQEGDSFEAMKSYAKEVGFTFPYAQDRGQKVYPKWGATRTPHAFVVENTSNGKILRYAGAIDDNARDEAKVTENYIDNAITAINNGQTVTPSTMRAIGCTIKTK